MYEIRDYGSLVGVSVGLDGGTHVQHVAAPSRHDKGSAFPLELRQYQADQRTGLGHYHGSSRGDGGRHATLGGRNVGVGQPFSRQVQQFLQRLLVMAQPGGDIDVTRRQWVLLQRLRATNHCFGHLHHIHTAREFSGDVHDGLGGVIEHGLHLVAVGHRLRHVRRQEHAHHKVNVWQRVGHRHGVCDVT